MSVNINDFKNFTEFCANKVQSGNSVTTTQFNEVAHRAQMQVFEKDRAIFVADGITTDYMRTFFTSKIYNGPFVTGELALPSNYEHTSDIVSYNIKPSGGGVNVQVEEVKNSDWGRILSSSLKAPTLTFPKYREKGQSFEIAPIGLSTVTLEYFRTPVKPVWGFTIVNGRPVYDATNSTNFEWDDFTFNNVAAYYLQLIGVNLKDGELSGFTQVYKQETNSAV